MILETNITNFFSFWGKTVSTFYKVFNKITNVWYLEEINIECIVRLKKVAEVCYHREISIFMKITLRKTLELKHKQIAFLASIFFLFNYLNAQCTVNGPSKYISICGSKYTLTTGRSVTSSGLYADTAVSYKGCDSIFQVRLSLNAKPTASILLNSDRSQCLNGNSYSFDFSGNAITSGYSASWNFGDGGANATGASVSKTYSTSNTFKIVLSLTNDSGCVDTESYSVFVRPQPTVAFSVNNSNQCFKGNNFSFTNSSSISSGSLSYVWNFEMRRPWK